MKKTPVIVVLIILIVILGIGLALRASKSDETVATDSGAVVAPPVNSGVNPPPSGTLICDEMTVVYTDSGFSPSTMEISAGSQCRTVVFHNQSSRNMWVASDPHPTHNGYPAFDADRGSLPDETYSFTFPAGTRTYPYHNHLDARHKGSVVVR